MNYTYYDPTESKYYIPIKDVYKVINRSPFSKYVKERLTTLYNHKLRGLPDYSTYHIPSYYELVNRACTWTETVEGHIFWQKQALLYQDVPLKLGHKKLEDL